MVSIIMGLLYLVLGPLFGGLVTGLDRRITARMQGRFGPPILQPFYDVLKLFEKEQIVVRRSQNVYVYFYLLFIVFTGALFFMGEDLLLVIFSLTLAAIFFVLAGYKGGSPFSIIGAERELLQMMAYEPMVLMMAVGMYMATKSFYVGDIVTSPAMPIMLLPGIFIGLTYVLTIKLRKSPFDLSTSHHGHQELVKGITTEYSGPALALIEIAHFYEMPFLVGFVFLFFGSHWLIGLFVCAAVYFLEILIDNTFARTKWQFMVAASWFVAAIFGFGNIIILSLLG